MSRRTTDVVYNVSGQVLEIRVIPGVPSSPTATVFNDATADDGTSEFTDTPTIDNDTVSTTVDVASGASEADPYKLSLATTTGIVVGRKYLLEEGSRRQWVEPVEIATDDHVKIRHPLLGDWSTSATLKSTYLLLTVDATWIADENNITDHIRPEPAWRVAWDYTAGGTTYREYTYFDVVRAVVRMTIGLDDLEPWWPDVMNSLDRDHRVDRGAEFVASAGERLRARLRQAGINDAAVRDDEVLREYQKHVLRRILAEGGRHPGNWESAAEFAEFAIAQEERFFELHFQLSRPPVDLGSGGDASIKSTPPSLWSK